MFNLSLALGNPYFWIALAQGTFIALSAGAIVQYIYDLYCELWLECIEESSDDLED